MFSMVVFRKISGVPLQAMIIQLTGKGKDKDRVM
jgi:hypothetical protein